MGDIKTEFLRTRLPFWDTLSEGQRAALSAGTRFERCKKHGVIYNGGDLGMIIVRRGRLCVYTVAEDGREHVLMRLFTGAVCALASLPVMQSAEVQVCIACETETDIMIIDSGAFADICKSSIDAELFVRRLMTKHFSDAVANMQGMMQYSAERRVATYICGESERTGSLRVKTTHEQIAKNIGTAREVVSRTIGRLAAQGVIEAGRGVIIIKDQAWLKGSSLK